MSRPPGLDGTDDELQAALDATIAAGKKVPPELAVEISKRMIARREREEKEKREAAFAYLATMAILCLRGEAALGMLTPRRVDNEWRSLPNHYTIELLSDEVVVFAECDPAQIAEALVLELAGFESPATGAGQSPTPCRRPPDT